MTKLLAWSAAQSRDGQSIIQQAGAVMKRALAISTIVLPVILIATTIFLATRAHAGPEAEHRGHWVSQGQWQMNDIGRNHGVLGGPGIPKCNPWVSPECARLHPSLFGKVPRPTAR